MVYYSANEASPVFGELRALLLKTAGLVDVLADSLKPVAAKLRLAFVYGSIASGTEQGDSAIDLMLIGAASPAELSLPLRKARELLGREVNTTIYSVAEFTRKRAAKGHFLMRVLDKPRLVVLGKGDELANLAD